MITTVRPGRQKSVGALAELAVGSQVSQSHSKIVVIENVRGLKRVRLHRVNERKGSVNNEALRVVTTSYLDGHSHVTASTRSYVQEDEVPYDAVPVKTKDVTDFGRLSQAAKNLSVSMAQFGPDNEPSPEQLAVFVAGYRNLLAWRVKARESMMRAEGEIDFVEMKLSQIL